MRYLVSCLVVVTLINPGRAEGQAGHDPRHSPYRDIRHGHSVTALVSRIGGDGGSLGLGPHGGTIYGLRYDIRVSGPIQFGFSVANGNLERLIQDPDDSVATRQSGPVSQSVTFAEVALQFNLTGAKTWRGLAPYVSGAAGFALASSVPSDSTGYEFGNKIFLAPAVGLRYFISGGLHLRAEARALFWKLTYPSSFAQEPAAEPGDANNPNALIPDGKLDEWTTSSWLQVGVGFTFSF